MSSKETRKRIRRISGVAVWCRFDKAVSIADLKPHPKNPNTHPDTQIETLAEIIRYNGWRAPITVSNLSGCITRGHGRLMAAEKLGLEAVPVEFQDYESEADELADLIADNRIAELAEIDQTLLDAGLAELKEMDFNLELAGFSDVDFDELKLKSPEPPDTRQLVDEIFAVVIECKTESEQAEVLDRLTKEGLNCRALIL